MHPTPPDEGFSGALLLLSDLLHKTGRSDEAKALDDESQPAIRRQWAKSEMEAKELKKLPRAPTSPDVVPVTEEEMNAAIAAAHALSGNPPS
jgi:hypothetical protein